MEAPLLPWPSLAASPAPDAVAGAVTRYGPGIELFGDSVVHALKQESANNAGTPQLQALVKACGGAEKWHGWVEDCVNKVNAEPGGLRYNWFKFGSSAGGPYGMCCLTCGGKCTALGAAGGGRGSPFNNFLTKHLKSPGHEKHRDAVLAQVEAAATASGSPRAELAMQILASRVGLVSSTSTEPPRLHPVGSEPLGAPTLRSATWSALVPEQPATKQEQLDLKLGTGSYVVNADGSLAGYQLCSRHRPRWIHLSNPNWVQNATVHYEWHTRPKDGMQRLDFFGIKACSARLCDAPAAASFRPDRTTACHGFWLDSVTYGSTTYDTDTLIDHWKPGKVWSAQPRFKATLVQQRTSEAQELFALQGSTVQWQRGSVAATGVVSGYESLEVMFVQPDATSMAALHEAGQLRGGRWVMVSESEVQTVTRNITGTYKHDECDIFCTDPVTGQPLANLTCKPCSGIPQEDDFRRRLQARSTELGARVRIDNLPTVQDLIESHRNATKRARDNGWMVVLARTELARSRCRERNLRERLEAGLLTGDMAGLVHDLKNCQVHGKFVGKEVMLSCVKDVVHDLRLHGGSHSKGMRWHESSKRLLGALRKWGGPRCHRLLRLNVGAASLRTVERSWNRDIFHYQPGVNDATFIQLARLLKPKMAALELREGEKLPCEFEQDETPILSELT